MTWGVDGEGRTSSAGSGSPLFGTTYNAASQPTQLSFSTANSDGDTFTYDSTGRMKSYTYTVNSQSVTGSLTWNANGTLSSLLITDTFNAANMQNCTYSHDDLVRIASVNCGASTWHRTSRMIPSGTSLRRCQRVALDIFHTNLRRDHQSHKFNSRRFDYLRRERGRDQ